MNDREQFTILDAITIVSFMIGLANYGENVDQSAMSKIVQGAVDDIHRHLADQDEKLSKLLTKLEVT